MEEMFGSEETPLSPQPVSYQTMEEYVFCDNIVFNNMPIYTYLSFFVFYGMLCSVLTFFFLCLLILNALITFDCIIAPPGGHSR